MQRKVVVPEVTLVVEVVIQAILVTKAVALAIQVGEELVALLAAAALVLKTQVVHLRAVLAPKEVLHIVIDLAIPLVPVSVPKQERMLLEVAVLRVIARRFVKHITLQPVVQQVP